MKIVIDIDENSYKATCSGSMLPPDVKNVVNAIKNGTVIPKGHGELIDKDVVLDMMNHGILEEYITTMGGVIHADR